MQSMGTFSGVFPSLSLYTLLYIGGWKRGGFMKRSWFIIGGFSTDPWMQRVGFDCRVITPFRNCYASRGEVGLMAGAKSRSLEGGWIHSDH
jgi:hypothetical protein